ncbi:MAG: thiamine diphosphokinase [Chloroflexota bacterium]
MPRCLIFANGTLPDLDSARRLLRADDFILCADGGTRHALALGLTPSVIIGDLDSISDADQREMRANGVQVFRYPREKDETDLELALDYAVEHGYREIVVVAALGERLDQTLANLALLANPRHASPDTRHPPLDIRLDDGVESAWFCRARSEVRGRSGDLVSLIPWGGEVTGARTQGLRWPLSNETLYPHKTRGVSNELTGEVAQVQIESGLLLIVHRRERQS